MKRWVELAGVGRRTPVDRRRRGGGFESCCGGGGALPGKRNTVYVLPQPLCADAVGPADQRRGGEVAPERPPVPMQPAHLRAAQSYESP